MDVLPNDVLTVIDTHLPSVLLLLRVNRALHRAFGAILGAHYRQWCLRMHVRMSASIDMDVFETLWKRTTFSMRQFVNGSSSEDALGNACSVNGEFTLCQRAGKFTRHTHLSVRFRRVLQAPYTIMMVAKSFGDITFWDGANRVFELCHGFPVNGQLRICLNTGVNKLYGTTLNGSPWNVYTVSVDAYHNIHLRVNSNAEAHTQLEDEDFTLQGLIIGSSREIQYKLHGEIFELLVINDSIDMFDRLESYLALLCARNG